MQITRPVMQRGSSAPGLLLPIGTPASQPLPVVVDGEGFGVGLGVGLAEDGVVDGFVAAALEGVVAAVVADDVAESGTGAPVEPVGATGVVADDPTAAFSAETVLDPCDAHPAAPIATAPGP